ncbi:MAG: hypothetical protein NTW21_42630 [Verrucomicrobia bacterium]|nr:hypothetical protein [Verrucomicrobiota bacterium]
MDKDPFESCERCVEAATPGAADQAAGTGSREVADPVSNKLGAAADRGGRCRGETSEVLWHETCRPGGLPCLRLPSALAWIGLGGGAARLAKALLVARGTPAVLAPAPVAPRVAIRQPPGPALGASLARGGRSP